MERKGIVFNLTSEVNATEGGHKFNPNLHYAIPTAPSLFKPLNERREGAL